ncbi:unnamed protein product, partial [Mesorhabditis spiculigera]
MLTNLFFLGLVGQVATTPETFVALNMSDRTYCAVFTTEIEGQLKLNADNETSSYSWKMGVRGNDSHALGLCSVKSDSGLDANAFLIPIDQPEITPDNSLFDDGELNKTEPWIAVIGQHANGSYELERWALVVQPRPGMPLVEPVTLKAPENASGIMLASGTDGYSCPEVRLPLEDGSVMVLKNVKVAAFQSFKEPKFPEGQKFVDCKHEVVTSSSLPVLIGVFLAVVVACAFVGAGVVLYKRHLERTEGYADF